MVSCFRLSPPLEFVQRAGGRSRLCMQEPASACLCLSSWSLSVPD